MHDRRPQIVHPANTEPDPWLGGGADCSFRPPGGRRKDLERGLSSDSWPAFDLEKSRIRESTCSGATRR